MIALLHSANFPESDPVQVAELAAELGYDGVELAVHGRPSDEDRHALRRLGEVDTAVPLLHCDDYEPDAVQPWAELAAEYGCQALRTSSWPEDGTGATVRFEALAAVAATTGVRILICNHARSCFRDLAVLAQFLSEVDPHLVAAALAPDQLPRWRDGEHAAWMARLVLPPAGAVVVGNYQWVSQLGAGNRRLWQAKLAPVTHGLTPWQAWLDLIREAGFDGLFTFGDATLSASLAERLRVSRDDLRWVRRIWHPDRAPKTYRPREFPDD